MRNILLVFILFVSIPTFSSEEDFSSYLENMGNKDSNARFHKFRRDHSVGEYIRNLFLNLNHKSDKVKRYSTHLLSEQYTDNGTGSRKEYVYMIDDNIDSLISRLFYNESIFTVLKIFGTRGLGGSDQYIPCLLKEESRRKIISGLERLKADVNLRSDAARMVHKAYNINQRCSIQS